MDSAPTSTIELAARSSPGVAAVGISGMPGESAGVWSGLSNDRITQLHCVALALPLLAGVAMYGWRAAATIATVVGTTLLATLVGKHVGRRGHALRLWGMLHLALLLALTLPAHLFAGYVAIDKNTIISAWPILPGAAITLVALSWLLGGSHRVHPVLLANMLMIVLFEPAMAPRWVLKPTEIFRGDLLHVEKVDGRSASSSASTPDAEASADAVMIDDAALGTEWYKHRDNSPADAIVRPSVAWRLTLFTTGVNRPDRSWLSLENVIRDDLPPLDDLFFAGQPGPIGTTSAFAVVIGGLVLLYCGLSDYRIPLLMVLSAYAAILTLPVPVVVTETGPQWQWLAFRSNAAGWDVALTFANYELLSSPLLFAAMFLAVSPSIRPMPRAWRPASAIIAGILAAAAQLYVGVATGPYIALLLAGLLTPAMDRLYRSRAAA
jgi:Na+-translocating ferredoxin:NAD+ oxidoreductase RnfD subunit